MLRLRPLVAVCTLWLLASTGVVAATIYRWVDEQGKVHYSEVVPERYRGVARAVGAPANEPSDEQQREALERARKDKANAAAIATDRDRLPAAAASAAASAQPATKRPAKVPDDQTDCETWQRLYLESSECFGPYRTVRGATKPEAFSVCNVVPEPPSRCRPRIP